MSHPLGLCEDCDGTSGYSDAVNLAACKTVRSCTAGTYQTAAPTKSSNRQCGICGTGKYSSGTNQLQCSECSAGTYNDASEQSSCKVCGLGRYQDATGQDDCKVISAGYYGTGGSSVSRTGVAECSAGYYCPGGADSQTACDGSQSYQDQTGQQSCKTVSSCGAGQRQTGGLWEPGRREQGGGFWDDGRKGRGHRNLHTMLSLSRFRFRRLLLNLTFFLCCAASGTLLAAPTTQSNRQCGPCPTDTYQSQASHSSTTCTSTTRCTPGQYIKEVRVVDEFKDSTQCRC